MSICPSWTCVGKWGPIYFYVNRYGDRIGASLCSHHGGGPGHWSIHHVRAAYYWPDGVIPEWPWSAKPRHDLAYIVLYDAQSKLSEAARAGEIVRKVGHVQLYRARFLGRTVWCAIDVRTGARAVARTWRRALWTLRARLTNYRVTIEPGAEIEVWVEDAVSPWREWWAPSKPPLYYATYSTPRSHTHRVWERRTWRAPRPRQLQQDPRLRARVRALLPATGARDTDGRLVGYKILRAGTGRLVSPTYHAEWAPPAAILTAKNMPATNLVRCQQGIHACWPDRAGQPDWDRTDLPGVVHAGTEVVVEVRGWGRYVAGVLGWRAEHAQVVRVLIPSCSPPKDTSDEIDHHERLRCRERAVALLQNLCRAYPDIPIELMPCPYSNGEVKW